jgi:tripartite ATP-independent transporter DctM subunit
MTDPQVAMVMMGSFIITILLGFPICFTLVAMGVGFGYYAYATPDQMDHLFQNNIFDLLVNQTYSVMTNDVLTAVPLFLFMGYIIERSNVVERLFFTLNIGARKVPGAMAVAALITCAIFATAVGIVGAVVTLMGLLAFPALLKAGYDETLSAGVICAGGCLGIMIPPSILLIVYGAISGVSVVRLYSAAFLPGFLLASFYIVYVILRAYINPKLAPKPPREDWDIPRKELYTRLLTSVVPLAVLIMAVLGSIVFGLATPSEAAAVGAVGAIGLAAAYRELTWDRLKQSVYLTTRTSAMVCWLFVGSWTFSSVFFAHPVPDHGAVYHLPPGLAAGMERDHHHLRADLSAAAGLLRDRPALLRDPRGAQPADLVPDATSSSRRSSKGRCRSWGWSCSAWSASMFSRSS